ncbi:glycosyltransferase family 2 protein [Pseudolysinimonas sp.]|uniref:glycosyltransferase family 2 protein n=1 Tax=Pseudolysinimonas sp. TaxID=2680009 RepID=UPI003F7EF664
MQPRVTAIVVVRNGARWLDRTIAAVAAQTRPVDAVVWLDAGSTDEGRERMPEGTIRAPAQPFGASVATAQRYVAGPGGPDDWLWLLRADTAPEPDALERLLAAVEVAPSVAIAGPKLVDPDDRGIIRSFGESLTPLGATVRLVEDELDQAQHDRESDVLGVTDAGMLVRRGVLHDLDGFDPGLPTADAGLDLSIRARLAGHRVVRIADARVSAALAPEDVGRRRPRGGGARRRIGRTAQLHRRLVYAPAAALAIHWLSLVPLAILRSIGQLLAKRPGAVAGEIAAAFAAAFAGNVPAARRRLRRGRRIGWNALAPLRVPRDELRERRATARERAAEAAGPELVRASFLSGGLAVTVLAAVVGVALSWRLFSATALEGGALRPLADVGTMWARIGWGPRPAGAGLTGPSDPFSAILAVLGSLTPWNPSLALVLLWITALPLSALGAWWAATRVSSRAWPPALAAALWALAPPLLVGLDAGRPGAVIAHLLLPWLALAVLEGARSWSAAATGSLLFAAIVAAAPILAPALVLAIVAWAVARPWGMVRILGTFIPAAALFAPLVVAQVQRGHPLALLADPGVALPSAEPTGWRLLLGHPTASTGWEPIVTALGIPPVFGGLLPAILLAPLAVLALLALFLPGSRRAIPALVLALVGLATAVAAVHLGIANADGQVVTPWAGSALSLYWLGLVAAAVVGLDALGRAAVGVGVAGLLAAAIAVAPVAALPALGASSVEAGDGRMLPALVAAATGPHPQLGTLVLTPQPDGSLAADVERGAGTTLDGESTLWSTRRELDATSREVARLAGNLASQSGADVRSGLQREQIAFVVVAPTPAGATPAQQDLAQRAAEALDGDPALQAVGTTDLGSLWRFADVRIAPTVAAARTPLGTAVLIGQGVVIALALLLAIPTGRRRRVVQEATSSHDDPADTFDEDDQ